MTTQPIDELSRAVLAAVRRAVTMAPAPGESEPGVSRMPRVTERLVQPEPLCKCGCGRVNSGKNRGLNRYCYRLMCNDPDFDERFPPARQTKKAAA